MFHGRENVVRRSGMMSLMFGRKDEKNQGNNGKEDGGRDLFAPLTFDCLLNCLDGVRTDGRDLHDHHDQRPVQDRSGPGSAAQAAGRLYGVHLNPPGRVDKASN